MPQTNYKYPREKVFVTWLEPCDPFPHPLLNRKGHINGTMSIARRRTAIFKGTIDELNEFISKKHEVTTQHLSTLPPGVYNE